jgi:hypothetical protein
VQGRKNSLKFCPVQESESEKQKKSVLTSYSEHLGSAFGALAFCGRLLVLEGDLLRVFHLSLGLALDAISLDHLKTSLHSMDNCFIIFIHSL